MFTTNQLVTEDDMLGHFFFRVNFVSQKNFNDNYLRVLTHSIGGTSDAKCVVDAVSLHGNSPCRPCAFAITSRTVKLISIAEKRGATQRAC